VARELVLERVPRPAGAVTARAAALDHEVGDHAVEHEAVVVAVGSELREVLDRLRSIVFEELELDGPLARAHDSSGHVRDATSGRLRQAEQGVLEVEIRQGRNHAGPARR